jgi:apolipoprotein N-acyltransferase
MVYFSLILSVSLSSIFYVFSPPPYNLSPLSFIFILPLHIISQGMKKKNIFFLWFLSGFLTWVGMMHWLRTSINIAELPSITSLTAITFLALLLGFFWGIFGLLRGIIPYPSLIRDPILWVCLEYIRGFFFPWGFVGYSLWKAIPIIQIADITGIYGISFFIIFICGFLCDIWDYRDRKKFILLESFLILFITSLISSYGLFRITHLRKEDGKMVNVLLINTGTPQVLKWREKYEFFERYIMLTLNALNECREKGIDVELVVWPETALTFLYPEERELSKRLFDIVSERNIKLLTGGIRKEGYRGRFFVYNTAFLITPSFYDFYDKLLLVPFGEYTPFRNILNAIPIVKGIFQRIEQVYAETTRGREEKIFSIGDKSFSTPICWEALFPWFVRRFVKDGANFIVNISNDAWFEGTSAIEQHFVYSIMRAVENRVYFLRSSNMGIGGVISPLGKVIESTKEEGHLLTSITLKNIHSFYSNYGDIFSQSLILLLIVMIWKGKKNR